MVTIEIEDQINVLFCFTLGVFEVLGSPSPLALTGRAPRIPKWEILEYFNTKNNFAQFCIYL